MELRQLRYFLAVAEELHFGRAAARVHVSQPPLSQQIKSLEEELGVELLRRTSRNVTLTEAGQAFLDGARRALDEVERAAGAARFAAQGETGRLHIGFVGPALDGEMPQLLRAFRERWPQVELHFSEMLTRDQLPALREGRLDLDFLRLFGHDLSGLESRIYSREPYVLALPEGHPLTSLGRVPLGELRDIPLIMLPRNLSPALYDAITACCLQAGFEPRIAQEAATKRTTLALVATGLGAAIVPASSSRAGVALRPLSGELPPVEISAVWRSGHKSPALENLVGLLQSGSAPSAG